MRRDDARELAAVGACLAGALAAGAGGGLEVWSAIAGATLTLGVSVARPRFAAWSSHLDLRWMGSAAALAAGLAAGWQGGVWYGLKVALLAALVVSRVTPPRSGTDRAALLAATLLIVLGASTSGSPLLGLAVALWAACAPLAALLANLPYGTQREVAGRHLALVSAIVITASAVLFVGLPRLGGAVGPPAVDGVQATTGFAPDVRLGDIDRLRDDPTVVLVLRGFGPSPAPTHVRGRALDTFDGRTWTATVPPDQVLGTGTPASRWEVLATPHAGSVAFAPGLLTQVPPGFVPSPGAWRLAGPPRGYRSTVVVVDVESALDPHDDDVWTRLPPGSSGADLARLAVGASAGEKAASVLASLSGYTYTRVPQEAGVDAPLDEFFRRRSGHCEHFATAAALSLRASGVPSRVVTGYAGPEPVGDHAWFFRRSHAHAWVEYRDEEGRWWTLDPTPGGPPGAASPSPLSVLEWADLAWRERVLAYDQRTQSAWVARAGRWAQRRLTGIDPGEGTPWLGVALVAGALLGGVALAWRGARAWARRLAGETPPLPSGRVARAHALARRALRRAGLEVPPALPPIDAARWVQGRAPEAGAALERLAWLHYRVRYGGESDLAGAAAARRLAGEVARAIRRETVRGGAAPEAPG